MSLFPIWRGRHWSLRLALVLSLLYLLYALLAGLLAPRLAEQLGSEELSRLTGRDVRLGEVSINPFLFRLRVRDFAIADPQTELLAAFGELLVDFELSSVWRRSWHFDRLQLDGLDLRAQHNGDGNFSFDSLLASVQAQLPAPDEAAAEAPAEDTPLPPVSVRTLALNDGSLRFTEASGAQPRSLTLPVAFRVQDFSTRGAMASSAPDAAAPPPSADAEPESDAGPAAQGAAEADAEAEAKGASNRYAVVIEGPDGGVLRWGGRFSLRPLQASGRLAVEGIDLRPFLDLVADRFAFTVPSSELSLATDYRFVAEPQPRLQLAGGELSLQAFAVQAPTFDAPPLQLQELALSGIAVDTLAAHVELAEVRVQGLEAHARLDADGLDLLRLLTPVEAEAAAASADAVSAAAAPDAEASASATSGAGVEADAGPGTGPNAGSNNGPDATVPGQSAAVDDARADDGTGSAASGEPGGEGGGAAVAETAPPVAPSSPDTAADWTVAVGRVHLTGRLQLTDATLDPPQPLAVEDMAINLHDLSVAESIRTRLDGGLRVAGGRLDVNGGGSAVPLDLQLALQAEGVDLAQLAPWVRAAVPLELRSGSLDGALDIALREGDDAPVVGVSGGLSVSGLQVDEPAGELLALQDARVQGLDVQLAEQSLRIADVTLSGMRLINRVDADGLDAAARITRGAGDTGGGGAGDGAGENADAGPGAPWTVAVDRLQLDDSLLRHEDATVSPPFAIALHRLAGAARNIRTTPGQRIDIDVTARVDDSAPLSLQGQLSPEPLFADLKVSLEGYDMRPLTPFTGAFLGYAVDKGLLAVDSTISLQDATLKSGAEITANQFYLGESIPSESAIKAPVKLGLAVLRNRAGRIRLPIAIDGDLDDPQFSVGGVVAKVLGNIIIKAATAPFSILASLAGGRDLQQIPFAPGSADVDGEALESLQALVKVLTERPELGVALTGNAGAADREALAAADLAAGISDDRAWPGIDAAVADEALRQALLKAYRQRFDADLQGLVPESADRNEQETKMAQARAAWQALLMARSESLPRSVLSQLANQRAERARAWLLERQLSAERVLTSGEQVGGDFSGLTLSLK